MASSRVWIAFGSNLAEPEQQLLRARQVLNQLTGIHEEAASPLYRTPPYGVLDQPDFVNAVVRYRCELSPHALIETLLKIELDLGRVRTIKNGPRTIDLDVLLIDDQIINTPKLVVPHPRMHERAFVLKPLTMIDPDIIIPNIGLANTFLQALDTETVTPLENAQWHTP